MEGFKACGVIGATQMSSPRAMKTMSQSPTISIRKAALISGFGILIMTLFFLLADTLVFQKLIVSGDAMATAKNITSNSLKFRIGICGFLMVILCDLLVAWGLYIFLKPVNSHISLFAAWFRIVYSVIYAVALGYYFHVLQLLGGSDYLRGFETTELQAQAVLAIGSFDNLWAIGFVFFGLHILLLGVLAYRSSFVPKALGVLLTLVGLAYLIDYFSRFLFPENFLPVSTYLGWGELIFMFWLLFKGGKTPRYETK